MAKVLWIALLIALSGYVVADFASSPFTAPAGSAAVRPTAVKIFLPGTGANGEGALVIDQAASALELDRHPTSVGRLGGGSTRALIDFLSRRGDGRGEVLAITSTTLTDLAHDRRERLVPGAAEEAALARALLRRAKPIGMLASEPMQVAVPSTSTLRNGSMLLQALAANPGGRLFGIGDDTFSRDELANLISGAGVAGQIHFSVFSSPAGLGPAAADGTVGIVMAGRAALRPMVDAGRLRNLGWPLPGPGPRAWIALVARPDIAAAELHRLRSWVASLQTQPRWRGRQVAAGRRPARPGTGRLGEILRHPAAADHLERTADEVEHR